MIFTSLTITVVDQIQQGLLANPKTSLDLSTVRKWGNEKCRCIGYDGVPGSANVTIAGKESTAKWRLIHVCEPWWSCWVVDGYSDGSKGVVVDNGFCIDSLSCQVVVLPATDDWTIIYHNYGHWIIYVYIYIYSLVDYINSSYLELLRPCVWIPIDQPLFQWAHFVNCCLPQGSECHQQSCCWASFLLISGKLYPLDGWTQGVNKPSLCRIYGNLCSGVISFWRNLDQYFLIQTNSLLPFHVPFF